jgi:hypothetical protein
MEAYSSTKFPTVFIFTVLINILYSRQYKKDFLKCNNIRSSSLSRTVKVRTQEIYLYGDFKKDMFISHTLQICDAKNKSKDWL